MLFKNLSKIQITSLIIIHILLGVACQNLRVIADIVYYILLVLAFLNLFTKQNKNEVATIYICYLVGFELVTRLCKSNVPWEGAKYILAFFFLMSRQFQLGSKQSTTSIFVYIMFLLPSIALSSFESFDDARKEISFNLSGPLSLGISVIYFSNRVFTLKELSRIFLFTILPLLTAGMIIFLRIPALSQIKFNDAANFSLSGGFGPNQVSTIYAFGIVLMLVAYFLEIRVTHSRLVDRIITFAFFVLCVINFSRGGIVTAAITVFLSALIWFRYSVSQAKNAFMAGFAVIIIVVFFLFSYFDNLTGNSLSQRYAGSFKQKNPKFEQFGSGVSGRDELVEADFEIFKDNPVLGIGVGMAKEERNKRGFRNAASHTEFSRLLSEHGLFGLTAMIILITIPFSRFFSTKTYYRKLMIVAFVTFALVSTTHNAMRLTVMGFAYGLAFINLMPNKDERDLTEQVRQQYLEWDAMEKQMKLS